MHKIRVVTEDFRLLWWFIANMDQVLGSWWWWVVVVMDLSILQPAYGQGIIS
jgi:hypothetical protein